MNWRSSSHTGHEAGGASLGGYCVPQVEQMNAGIISPVWSTQRVVHALKRGYGIAAISRYVVAAELRTGSLAAIRVRGWNVRNIVSVLRVRDAKLTPSADLFQTFVRTEMARRRTR
jgi:DNA-binding transcriptional LysR family regulator